ncbi:alpha-hydroxy acid oxidase [Maritalea myrionectae]|uniref:alpha-hydroxy acid oxidase n=1 Tax=Maritalea myrionectae TaxID=454601 RepID=UPI000400B94A|nr:alpha-hydroxy acid oxidase [Maritalea myrionectae]
MATPDKITTIGDLKKLAKRRVPRMFFDYADSGALTEDTYRANERDFEQIKLRQRVAVNIANRSTATKMIGQDVAMPLAIAPTGSAGLQHADGEMLAAQACAEFGVPYTLSTLSICSLEDVAAASSRPIWFQLYVMKDRGFSKRLIARAKAAKCSALVLTLDLQIMAQRHKDVRNGLSAPPKINLNTMTQFATKPLWCLNMLGTKNRQFGNIHGHVENVSDLSSLSAWISEQFDEQLNWDDIAWIKEQWGGPLILKGIMDPEDAKMALKVGADAMIVSNHGGRQLDGTESSIAALPKVLDAVQGDSEIHLDGGVRTGIDILRARALGAQGVYVGRPYLYGLGAMGKKGVTKALQIFNKELDITMALCGENNIENIGRHNLI